ncbi:unnamed protein product [Prorocentrum cordatum]|uniref:Uncharacterized protein n=1 Tax=Prorocentrum cordatum TaxID=2364126 RepID=A0ABN9VW17_9DINO|nr:unnamed protein product [Polarella glacialis]
MPPANMFAFVQSRRRGGPRSRLRESQLKMLRLERRWSFPGAIPRGCRSVKDVVPLTRDAFCVVMSSGRADAFASSAPVARGQARPAGHELVWLASLSLFDGERVRLVARVRPSGSVLVVFAQTARSESRERRGTLYARVLDLPALLLGVAQVRDAGTLAAVSVPVGGFIECDEQNGCIWANDCQVLRCWDSQTFEQRFELGPWSPEYAPNVRFTAGMVALMRSSHGGVEVDLHDASSGNLLSRKLVDCRPYAEKFAFLELLNEFALMKRANTDVLIADLLGDKGACLIPDSSGWEPELFVFIPSRGLILARFARSLEIWRCVRPGTCCQVGVVERVMDFGAHRFSIDERLGLALVVQSSRPHAQALSPLGSRHSQAEGPSEPPPSRGGTEAEAGDDLALLDLVRFGGLRAALHGVCAGARGRHSSRRALLVFHHVRPLVALAGPRGPSPRTNGAGGTSHSGCTES